MYVYVCIIPIWTDEVRNPTAQRVSMERRECCTFCMPLSVKTSSTHRMAKIHRMP